MDQEYYIKKWLAGTLTDEERREFEQSDAFQDLRQMDQALQAFKAPELEVEEVFAELNLKPKSKHVTIPLWKSFLRVAAAVVLGVLLFQYYPVITQYFSSPSETVITLRGETKEMQLPDASEVTLNASSSISYRSRSWKRKRDLNLDGEAYFKVKKGANFTVNTQQGMVKVLGTEFNVKARPQYFEVICYEGSVLVEIQQHSEVLGPADRFRMIKGTLVKDRDLSAQAPSWIHDKSTFISIPYGEVLRELERQYKIQIESEKVDLQQLFTGSFTHENLDLALASITGPLNIGYEIREDQIVSLSGEAQ